MAPTPLWMMSTRASSLLSFSSDWHTASTEPCTSALTTSCSSFMSPFCICSNRLSSVTFVRALNFFSFCALRRCATSSRARRSSVTASNLSPAWGTSSSPVISTGTLGPADWMGLPFSFAIARTFPTVVPATRMSPTCRVPFCTSMVATGPRPLSSLASRTVPFPARPGLAFSSLRSATSRMVSSSSLRPVFFTAETFTHGVSPPHSSGTSSYFVSCSITRCGFAPGLSILLMATMMETLAAFAWWMASMVWGMMPSSAATTSTAMSVTCAPLARMVVKASWPGVSRNVMSRPPALTW